MEVSKIFINNEWRDVLIYTSTKPMKDFPHKKITELDNETIITTYSVTPYKEINEGGKKYYYWFLINSSSTDVIATYAKDVATLKEEVAHLQGAVVSLYEGGNAV